MPATTASRTLSSTMRAPGLGLWLSVQRWLRLLGPGVRGDAARLDTLVWAHMYDTTVRRAVNDAAELSVAPMVAPKIEPEIVFSLQRPLEAGKTPDIFVKSRIFPVLLAQQYLAWTLGRSVTADDDTLLSSVTTTFHDSGRQFRALIRAIVTSETFRFIPSEGVQ